MSEASTAMEKIGQPQSTDLSLVRPPNQGSAMTTVVPMDRENLTFFANLVKGCGLVPKATADAPAEVQFNRVMGKIVAATSYGFDPFLAQSCFDVMFGQMALNAKGQGILFRETGEYDLRIVSHDEKHCKVKVLKRIDGTWDASSRRFVGGTWHEIGIVEFNEQMASTAGLLTGPNAGMWKKYPRDMYFARVMTRLVKRFNPSCLLPKIILGNHFAKESQPTFQPPAANPEPNALPRADAEAAAVNDTPVEQEYSDVVDSSFVSADTDDEEVEGEVIEIDAAPVDPEESKHADLLTAAKELYADLDKAAQKKADEWLGQRVIKNLTTEELAEFLSTHQE